MYDSVPNRFYKTVKAKPKPSDGKLNKKIKNNQTLKQAIR